MIMITIMVIMMMMIIIIIKFKVEFTLEQTKKAHQECRCSAIFFL
jgi:hypothetical protein